MHIYGHVFNVNVHIVLTMSFWRPLKYGFHSHTVKQLQYMHPCHQISGQTSSSQQLAPVRLPGLPVVRGTHSSMSSACQGLLPAEFVQHTYKNSPSGPCPARVLQPWQSSLLSSRVIMQRNVIAVSPVISFFWSVPSLHLAWQCMQLESG